MRLLRVLLVDNHQMLTEALAVQLSTASDLWVVGRCTLDDPRLPQTVARLQPDVVSVDVEPVGQAAGPLVRELLAAAPLARIIVLTASHDPQQAAEVARAGANAWVFKENSGADFISAVRGVCKGLASYPDEVLGVVLDELRADARSARERTGPLDMLTAREREVLTAMVGGRSAGQIAQDLYVSTNTIRTHTRNILAKLNVHSQLEAVNVAVAAGVRPGRSVPSHENIAPVLPLRSW